MKRLLGANWGQEEPVSPAREWRQRHLGGVQALEAARVLLPNCVEHFVGGPVEPAEAFAMIEIPREILEALRNSAAAGRPSAPSGGALLSRIFDIIPRQKIPAVAQHLHVKSNIYFGELTAVMQLLASIFMQIGLEVRVASREEASTTLLGSRALKVFWGHACWNGTQLLGEIARRSWGLVVTDADLSFDRWE